MNYSFNGDDPELILRDRQSHNVIIGQARADDGTELCFINIGDGYRSDGDVLLSAAELERLILRLTAVHSTIKGAP